MGGDATNWDEESYRKSISKEREIQSTTVFRTVFTPSSSQNPPEYIVAASSDGSVAPYSISSCISNHFLLAEPICLLEGHNGPAYDVKFFGDRDDSLGGVTKSRWEVILSSWS
ncbi:hypothetical protein MKW94_008656, partial [Papaver nudicaule]|nr:hypothetical protein [Papaver nudicaule]